MKRIALLFVFFITTTICYGQFQEARLFLRNGDTLSGIAKIDESRVVFKKDTKGKRVRYNYKTLKNLEIEEKDKGTATYKYKIVPDLGPVLLKVVNEGDSQLCLYSYPITGNNNGGYWSGGVFFSTGDGSEFTVYRYYIGRNASDYKVEKVWSDTNGRGSKYFIKTVPSFFKDCQPLVDKIEDETFGRFDMDKIVDFYNKNCYKN